ncbi:hypothetical protein ES703_69072 [subsurface metagenome]
MEKLLNYVTYYDGFTIIKIQVIDCATLTLLLQTIKYVSVREN